jgi:hypothetical protein
MRSRLLSALVLVLLAATLVASPPVGAATNAPVVAAQGNAAQGNQGGSDGGGESETGPPWTYQMARVTLVLLFGLALAIGAIYYRLVVRRRRGEI